MISVCKKPYDSIILSVETLYFLNFYSLVNFSVPYLSYLAILALVGVSIAFYVIPANYLFMAFGNYCFFLQF